jgi:hypothetical protein
LQNKDQKKQQQSTQHTAIWFWKENFYISTHHTYWRCRSHSDFNKGSTMTAVVCEFCQAIAEPLDSVSCIGPCSRVFHHNCSGLTKNVLKALIDSPNLFFKCDLCATGCYKPLEDKIKSLAQQVLSLKGAVDKIVLENLKTPKAIQPVKQNAFFRKPIEGTSSNDTPVRAENPRKVVRGTGPKVESIIGTQILGAPFGTGTGDRGRRSHRLFKQQFRE